MPCFHNEAGHFCLRTIVINNFISQGMNIHYTLINYDIVKHGG